MTRIEKEKRCILLINILQYCFVLADGDQTCDGLNEAPQKLKYNNEDLEVCCRERQVAKGIVLSDTWKLTLKFWYFDINVHVH